MSEARQPPAFFRGMDRVFNFLSGICLVLAGTALVTMTLMFAWLVYGRYVLNDTPTWVEQVSHLLLMVIAFLGAAGGVRFLFKENGPGFLKSPGVATRKGRGGVAISLKKSVRNF